MPDGQRSLSLLLSVFVGLLDWAIESWIVGAGNYSYQAGLRPETPLTYSCLVLFLLGLLG